MRPEFKGKPLGVCDTCGFTMHLDQLRKEHTGALVCKKCFDPRHPQEFVKAIGDRQAVTNSRHVQTMDEVNFVTPTFPPNYE